MCWLIYWNPLSHKYPMTFDIYCLIPWVILTLFLIIFHLFCFVFDTFLLPTADRLSKIILRKNITCLKVFKLFSASCLSPFSSCNLYKSEKWQKINHILMKKRQYFAATTDRTWICWIHFSRFSWKGNLCIIAHAPQSNSQRSFPRDGGHTHTHIHLLFPSEFHVEFTWMKWWPLTLWVTTSLFTLTPLQLHGDWRSGKWWTVNFSVHRVTPSFYTGDVWIYYQQTKMKTYIFEEEEDEWTSVSGCPLPLCEEAIVFTSSSHSLTDFNRVSARIKFVKGDQGASRLLCIPARPPHKPHLHINACAVKLWWIYHEKVQ